MTTLNFFKPNIIKLWTKFVNKLFFFFREFGNKLGWRLRLQLHLIYIYCGGAKTWALAVGLSTTFYQQCVQGEEIIGKPHN